jgi:hypothetical protein
MMVKHTKHALPTHLQRDMCPPTLNPACSPVPPPPPPLPPLTLAALSLRLQLLPAGVARSPTPPKGSAGERGAV